MPKTKIQCEEIREKMNKKIIEGAIIYFAKNGYAGTKISQLAKSIGIGQGTLYNYFTSKEELFLEILKKLKLQNESGFENLAKVQIDAESKIKLISESIIKEIENKTITAYLFVLNIRMIEEGTIDNVFTKSYENVPTKILEDIILQGQSEGRVVNGDAYKLADYYWSVVHTLALMNINSKQNKNIDQNWLDRILLKDR
ncbi:TetR/AcrR family transcriptional regulator [Clostridium sp. CCUG 7971]|uniref:TetR/AcrR family transcriptional regulator n=1 Tax=Clostridium sp. CCUG 7971 TaxID=2811414 RepID=UPI001ABB37E0|nr:TetR/AcrR family transcriptional regulator [Clostridium sp. CCUG 7971]MBO3443881.1 TetR/AcrR family transcriptional regulator [Clostridium sp. CCUG 7971]